MFLQLKWIVKRAALAVALVCLSLSASGQIATFQPATQPSTRAMPPDSEPEIRLFKLERLDATKLASLVTSIFASAAAHQPVDAAKGFGNLYGVHVEPQTNTLVAVGDVQPIWTLADLVKKLDGPPPKSQEEFHVFQMHNRDAAEAAKILNDLFNPEPGAAGQPKDASSSPARYSMHLVVDGKANKLFVLADRDAVQITEEILNKLEVNDGPTEPPDLCIYRLKHAKAGPAAALLMAVFKFDGFPVTPENKLEAVQDPWYFNAVAYEATNSVVIAASHSGIHKATEVLEELDRSSDPENHPATQKAEQPTTIKFDLRRGDE